MYAITRDQATREKVIRLNRLYAETISGDYYDKNRFPTYCYDKLVCGLIDSHQYVGDPDAFSILERTTNAALPHFPKHAIEHGKDGGRIRTRGGRGTSLTRFQKISSWHINAEPGNVIASWDNSILTMSIITRWLRATTCLPADMLIAT